MCIRDRMTVALGLLAYDLAGANAGAVLGTALAIKMLAYVAVSYTHLRAHETVLDLVCRLLLEKKKQKQTTTIIALTTLKEHNLNK